MRVLLVDDDAFVRRATARALKQVLGAHATIHTAASVDEAIVEVALAPGFDLIVSDFDMGMRNGEDFLQWLRDVEPGLTSKFMFLSGSERAETLGVPFVTKPATVAELGTVVQQVLACAS